MAKDTGNITGNNSTGAELNGKNGGKMAVSVTGFGVATVELQWSFDGGTTWVTHSSYTSDTNTTVDSPSDEVIWRLRTTAYTSGTLVCGLAN